MLRASSALAVAALVNQASAGARGPGWGPGGPGGPPGGGPGGPPGGGPQPGGLLTDINVISTYWGQLSTYRDNDERYFGVQDVGIPDGCQIEQAHSLQRHAQRFPTGAFDDGDNDSAFAAKVEAFTKANPNAKFTGPLSFLNSYQYQIGAHGYLTGLGAATEFTSGVTFWNRYGRILYDATVGQLAYNATAANGSARPKPVLRTTSQSRIWNSQINWALGFFGSSFQVTPEPTLTPFTTSTTTDDFTSGELFDVVIIPEGGTENNTLASYDSCFGDDIFEVGYLGDEDMFLQWVPKYIQAATDRVNQYAPSGFTFTVNDTYAMQSICAYETGYIGQSDFCGLFTEDEWAGFEQSLDIEYYNDYAWGNPTGRAQGLGYQQELIARLENEYITVGNSSVNTTITDNAKDFPLGRPFYSDFTHDDIIVSVLTSMSIDYFKGQPDLNTVPPNPNRPFILSHLTPFGGRLITEVIGCNSANPTAKHDHVTQYYPGQYGYDAETAVNKFVRLRVNNGILPLTSIRTGECEGRTDGLCSLDNFLASQQKAMELANYQFACFANYTLNDPGNNQDYDGTVTPSDPNVSVYPGELTAAYIDSL